jgi:hypothetical protein
MIQQTVMIFAAGASLLVSLHVTMNRPRPAKVVARSQYRRMRRIEDAVRTLQQP